MCFDSDSLPPIPVISGAAVSHDDLVLEAADGNRFATVDRIGQVRAWETKTGKPVREWELRMPVGGVTFTPDGKHIVTANGNGTLYLLDLP